LSIFLLNIFRYARMDSSSTRLIPKSFVKLFLGKILVLNHTTNLV
jgi:hypothetical protein